MQTYELTISNRQITASGDTTLVRTSRGVDRIRISSADMEWLDFDLSVSISGVAVPLFPSQSDGTWSAVAEVPDSVLETSGAISIAVYGSDSSGNYIVTAASSPLTVEIEGDGIGSEPTEWEG